MSDRDTCHIQKVQKCGKDDGKDLDLVTYYGEATVNKNLGGNGNPKKIKRAQSSPEEGQKRWEQV